MRKQTYGFGRLDENLGHTKRRVALSTDVAQDDAATLLVVAAVRGPRLLGQHLVATKRDKHRWQ